MNLIRAATLVTRRVEATCHLYAEWFDYRVVENAIVSHDMAASWGAPDTAGRAYAVMQPASGAKIFLRFVEGDPVADYRPLRSYGWSAIEICNRDVMGVNERMLQSPFEIIGPPKIIEGLPRIHPMQVKGPEGEIIYLTEIKDPETAEGLPRPVTFIDSIFILVLACSDMDASAKWFCDTLGLTAGAPMTIVYNMINNAFSLPDDTRHTLRTASFGGDVFLEFDRYPSVTTMRPGHVGQIPPGIAIATLQHPNLDAITAPWIRSPVHRAGAVYGGKRVGTLKGPDNILVEIVET